MKTIQVAFQSGDYVNVKYEGGGNSTYYGQIHGYTSTTVSVKRGDYIYTYDTNGSCVSTVYSK